MGGRVNITSLFPARRTGSRGGRGRRVAGGINRSVDTGLHRPSSRVEPAGRCGRSGWRGRLVDMAAAAIDVTDLHKSYGRKPAVSGVTFSVAEGEIFGILGPNGAGRSGTRSGSAGRAGPAGTRDPRHHRAGSYRGDHPIAGGQAEFDDRVGDRARRPGSPTRSGQPGRGASLGPRSDPTAAHPRLAAGSASSAGGGMVDREFDPGSATDHGSGPAVARRDRGNDSSGGPGVVGQRGQTRICPTGRGDAVFHE